MKVTHFYKTYFPETQGGLEEAIRQIATYTTGEGVENWIYTVADINESDVIEFPEATVKRFPLSFDIASTPFSIRFALNFIEIVKSADILHFHFPWPFAELLFILPWCIKKPTIVTYHSDIVKQKYLKQIYQPFLNRFLVKIDVIVPTSENYLNSSLDLSRFREKCVPIPLFLGNARFSSSKKEHEDHIRQKYGDDFFLFVGVLRYYKGLQYLIPAMKDVSNNLVIVGKGPEFGKLKMLVQELGLSNVFFTGYVEDEQLQTFYQLARAVVFPSCERSEAFGMTILEALMMGKPVISTELGTGTSYANINKLTGLVIEPKNVGSIHKALNKLCNDDLVKTFSSNAKNRYVVHFSSNVVGPKYLELYKSLIN